MNNSTMVLYAVAGFVLGALVALGGEHALFKPKDQRDDMQTVGSFKDWRLNCPPRTNKKGVCAIQETLVQKSTNTPIVQLTVVPKDKADILTIVAPLGVLVPPGLRFAVGTTVAKTAAYATCLQAGCIAELPIDSDLAAAMSKNTGGQITIARLDGKTVALNYSLNGYSDALAARAVDTAARK